ncbi:hypothetical protein GCM10010446_68090 [Streptomyces enissocaesilis]|uniref:Uncharacterized protein n=1 Tax=Streptomyces enissocaesilis TaxID=332589 RepID=A0ABN3XQ77_9ACTN
MSVPDHTVRERTGHTDRPGERDRNPGAADGCPAAGAGPIDAAYAIGTLAFIDPHRSLPALRDALHPGAPFVLSFLHTDLHGRGPLTSHAGQRPTRRPPSAAPVDEHR